LQDPAAYKPGHQEADVMDNNLAKGAPQRTERDRHVILPPSALRAMLERIAAAGRQHSRYLEQRQANDVYVELHPGGELRPLPAP